MSILIISNWITQANLIISQTLSRIAGLEWVTLTDPITINGQMEPRWLSQHGNQRSRIQEEKDVSKCSAHRKFQDCMKLCRLYVCECFMFSSNLRGMWNDAPCDVPNNLVCKMDKFPVNEKQSAVDGCETGWIAYEGSCYFIDLTRMVWVNAESYCKWEYFCQNLLNWS